MLRTPLSPGFITYPFRRVTKDAAALIKQHIIDTVKTHGGEYKTGSAPKGEVERKLEKTIKGMLQRYGNEK